MNSTAARNWALKKIPTSVRESLLHQTRLLQHHPDNSIVKFWSILYSGTLYQVHIPSDLSEKSRQTLLHYLGDGLEQTKSTPTLIYKIYGYSSQTSAELESECRFLKHAHYLTVFVHRKGATDEMLQILGENCPCLQVSCYKKISDVSQKRFTSSLRKSI